MNDGKTTHNTPLSCQTVLLSNKFNPRHTIIKLDCNLVLLCHEINLSALDVQFSLAHPRQQWATPTEYFIFPLLKVSQELRSLLKLVLKAKELVCVFVCDGVMINLFHLACFKSSTLHSPTKPEQGNKHLMIEVYNPS